MTVSAELFELLVWVVGWLVVLTVAATVCSFFEDED